MRTTVCLLVAVIILCSFRFFKEKQNAGHVLSGKVVQSGSFLDSVELKGKIGRKQLQSRIDIRKIYQFNTEIFTGDTVFFKDGKAPLVVISYSDQRNLSYKFLFVYNKKTNKFSDYIRVQNDSDVDES